MYKNKNININLWCCPAAGTTVKFLLPILAYLHFWGSSNVEKNISNILTDPSLLYELMKLENLLKIQMSQMSSHPAF